MLKDDTTVQNNSIRKDSTLYLKIIAIRYHYYKAKYLLMARRYQITHTLMHIFIDEHLTNLFADRFKYEEPEFIKDFYPEYTNFNKDYVYQTCKAYIDTIYSYA